MRRTEIIDHLVKTGWQKHKRHDLDWYSKTIPLVIKTAQGPITEERIVRVRVLKTSVRVEMKMRASAGYFRIGGTVFRNVRMDDKGTMYAVTFKFPANP
jgi:hypothetical protein